MYYNTAYVGMDVHKESFTLRYFTVEMDEPSAPVKIPANYKLVLKYLDSIRNHLKNDIRIVCGYEAGCLGYSLYHQLTEHNVECIILAPSTIPEPKGKNRIKTDNRDAGNIATCLAHRTYKPVHIPNEQDEQVKEFIRMRDDHKLALKKVKQQILAFCLRHDLRYEGTKNHWTAAHLQWLHSLSLGSINQEVLEEYLLTYRQLKDKLERLDHRIEEMATGDAYRENIRKLSCFLGIKTHTALSILTEVGDFKRFPTAKQFASYLGLVPGEHSSATNQNRLGITKTGNRHIRMLLIEAAQRYGRGQVGYKSKALKARQDGNMPMVIAYADKANERLRRRYYRMVLRNNKKANVAKTAIARELACFIWGMMTLKIA